MRRISGGFHDERVDAEVVKTFAQGAFQKEERHENERRDRYHQRADKNAREDGARLLQPAREGVLPKVGND